MADLSLEEKSRIKIPLVWLAFLLGGGVSLGAGIAVAQIRLNQHDTQIGHVEGSARRSAESLHQHDTRISVLEEQTKRQERIEQKLDRLIELQQRERER